MTRGGQAPPKPDDEASDASMSGVSAVLLPKDLARGAGAALVAAILASAAPALAQTATSTKFTINLPNYAVKDLIIFDLGSPFSAMTEGSTSFPLAAGVGATTITDQYLTAQEIGQPGFVYTPGTVFLMGVTS